jgi:Ca2+-binding RTX toxin-like protein
MKKRVIVVLTVMVAVLVMASGAAMAGDLTKEKAAQEKTTQEKEAKEKKAQGKNALGASAAKAEKGQQQPNPVQCPNQSDDKTCIGTEGKDLLVGGEEFERIEGGKGADTYDGKGGGDDLFDASRKSNDLYIIPETEFNSTGNGGININDRGGDSDVLDLSAYSSTEFALSKFGNKSDNLLDMRGPENRSIGISSFFTRNTIDTFKFSDVTLTAKQIKQRVQ